MIREIFGRAFARGIGLFVVAIREVLDPFAVDSVHFLPMNYLRDPNEVVKAWSYRA